MTAPRVARGTSTKRRAAIKGAETRKRMAAARELERRDDEFTAEHSLLRPLGDRLLWPSSFRPSEE